MSFSFLKKNGIKVKQRHPIINGPDITVWPKICIGSGHGLLVRLSASLFLATTGMLFQKCNERPTATLR
jgi:hypothetical protein